MPADRARPLAAAAARRRATALERARTALADLDSRGKPVTFQAVARAAGVSRQWLYTQPELRSQIERLRDRPPTAGGRSAHERASDASLRQRIEALRHENQRLRHEVHQLRAELALAYGHQREATISTATPPRPRAGGSAPAP
jgi:hypothetical protein